MKTYPQFHDGFLEGLWIDRGIVHVYLSTLEKERTTAVLNGVVMLRAGGFREGNIIFEVLTRGHEEITLQDVAELYVLQSSHEPAAWEHQLIDRARKECLQIFEVNPSYGGTCLILARTVEFVTRKEWLERYT
jgi:hypothetical protein